MRVFVRDKIITREKIIDDRLTNRIKYGTRRSVVLPSGALTSVRAKFLEIYTQKNRLLLIKGYI